MGKALTCTVDPLNLMNPGKVSPEFQSPSLGIPIIDDKLINVAISQYPAHSAKVDPIVSHILIVPYHIDVSTLQTAPFWLAGINQPPRSTFRVDLVYRLVAVGNLRPRSPLLSSSSPPGRRLENHLIKDQELSYSANRQCTIACLLFLRSRLAPLSRYSGHSTPCRSPRMG